MKHKIIIVLLFFGFFFKQSISQEEARLMRFPSIQGNLAVFSYAGDLYSLNLNEDSVARRLTSDEGYEMFPKISPDGKYIAFTAQYDGNTEVYLMSSGGGDPVRLTYTATLSRDDVSDRMGPNNIVMAWTPDSKNIVYRSRCYTFNDFIGKLFSVSIEGDMPVELPFDEGGFCSYNTDGSKLAFNKIFREFRTWKYYKGGMADDIWMYDYSKNEAVKLFENDAQDIFPMWYENKIYFLSDRDRTMNLFVYDTETSEVKKVTYYSDYDIKFPSIGGDKIIFEKGGFLFYYDIKNDVVTQLSVYINNDFASTRDKLIDAEDYTTSVDISPKGERLIFSARGDIFSVPAKSGITKNLTKTSGAHDRSATWSPDGNYIAYLSDLDGEFEIYIQEQDGEKAAVQLTDGADTYYFSIMWSPDSKKILFYDKKLRLRYVDISTKKIAEVALSDEWEITDFDWSPDSKWIAYSLPNQAAQDKICLYNLASAETYNVTDGWYYSTQPEFSSDGRYLFFTSRRTFQPIYSDLEWNAAYKDMVNIYLVTLQKETPSPIAIENDEVGKKIDTSKVDISKGIKIDIEGIEDRIVKLPTEASNYWNLTAFSDKIFYTRKSYDDNFTASYYYDFKTDKENFLGNDISFSATQTQNKFLVYSNSTYYIADIPTNEFVLTEDVDLTEMDVWVDYEAEWKQIYDETWRQMRDFFYAPNLHGVDWDAVYDKYAVLLPYVKHRNDLTYLLGEMIGEINIGHAYVNGGDRPEAEQVSMGLLGAKFEKDAVSGFFKITEILDGENWNASLRSPLTEIGMDFNVGDYITAINSESTKDVNNIYELLVNTAEKQTEISVNKVAKEAGSTDYIVTPISSEADLYYYNWVETNLEKVDAATNGTVGYIHIPDMSSAGLTEFVKYFYPQLMKKGLIIDDRGNGGGNVSPMIIERLKREMVYVTAARNVPFGTCNPDEMVVGPKVMLINEYSASDGDLFPYQFKFYKMGTVIGNRTWGGIVGIRGSLPFIDGGEFRKPEYGKYSVDGEEWIIEGYGVDPDIEIENNPVDVYNGEDNQLDKAIDVILEDIKNFETKVDEIPPYPVKNK